MPTNYVFYFFPCTVQLISSENRSHDRNTTTSETIFTTYVTCLAAHIYLQNDRACVTADMIETQNTANQLTRKLESHGHKLHMDNFLSLSNLFSDLTNRKSTAPEDT
jgi:hypothetical protein